MTWAKVDGRVLYRSKVALDLASVELPFGKVVGLIGPNGSGKSTLIKALAGEVELEGSIEVLGRPVGSWPKRELARSVAVVPQTFPVPLGFTVRDIVLTGRYAVNPTLWESAEDQEAAEAAMARADCIEFADRPMAELSGGEAQRALLARALAQGAKVQLWDEPTAHLDLKHQVAFGHLARSLQAEGASILVACHDLAWCATFCDEAILLNEGSVVDFGPTSSTLVPDILGPVFGVGFQTIPGLCYPILKS